MYKEIGELKKTVKLNNQGKEKMIKTNLADFDLWNPKVRAFYFVQLKPGEEAEYHTHIGESETFFILSGEGECNDDGKIITASPGMVTFTPAGHSHSIKNTGDEDLVFIALIVVD